MCHSQLFPELGNVRNGIKVHLIMVWLCLNLIEPTWIQIWNAKDFYFNLPLLQGVILASRYILSIDSLLGNSFVTFSEYVLFNFPVIVYLVNIIWYNFPLAMLLLVWIRGILFTQFYINEQGRQCKQIKISNIIIACMYICRSSKLIFFNCCSLLTSQTLFLVSFRKHHRCHGLEILKILMCKSISVWP